MKFKCLNLVYTDICDPFPTASWNGHEYFITFTDNYSRYRYLYLFHEKSQSWTCLKPLDLIMVVSTMTDITNQVNVQNHLSISERVVLSLSIPYQGHLVKNGVAER